MIKLFLLFSQVVLEGVRGQNYQSDIAVDDVSIKPGACPQPGSCDFETGFCGYSNVQQGDQFDWDMGTGGTPSFYTGPKTDHTTTSTQGKISNYKMFISPSLRMVKWGILYKNLFKLKLK